MQDDLLLRLAIALGIGLIVGIERGWRLREVPDGTRVAGVRTFALSGFLGGIVAALSVAMESPAVLIAGLLVYSAVFAGFQIRNNLSSHQASATATVAGIAVFSLGALAVAGDPLAAGAGAVALASLLASREILHGLLHRLSWIELRSALLLLAMTVIVLPQLPNRTIDPWGGINPWEVWFFTVLTAGISFAGYVAIRIMGPSRGILVSALIGAIVSSTAVTMALGRRAKSGGPWQPLAGGAVLAAMVSVTRVFVIVAVVQPQLIVAVAPPALAGALVLGLIGGTLVWRASNGGAVEPQLGNPFDLGPLLVFAAGFAAVAGASAAATASLGAQSVIVTSGLSGMFNVDVAALTAARLAGDTVPYPTAAAAILLAIALNGFGRLTVAAVAGTWRYTAMLAGATLAAAAAGAAVAALTGLLAVW